MKNHGVIRLKRVKTQLRFLLRISVPFTVGTKNPHDRVAGVSLIIRSVCRS